MGNIRLLIKLSFPKCQSTLLFHEQHCQSLQLTAIPGKWEHASGPQEQRKFQHKRLVQGGKASSVLAHEQRKWGFSQKPLSGFICQEKNPSWKEKKTPPLNPLLFHSSLWFSTQTRLEVLKCNRNGILATLLLYSISTLLI